LSKRGKPVIKNSLPCRRQYYLCSFCPYIHTIMRILFSFVIIASVLSGNMLFAQATGYHVEKTMSIPGGTRWDYVVLSPVNDNLYVAHGTEVNIINRHSGAYTATIENTDGVHGIAFAPEFKKGFTSNGKSNTVTVFDINTNRIMAQIRVGERPDAIMYDPFSKKIIVCEAVTNDLAIIDPATNEVVKHIDVEGKPETAVSDETGHIYVNIEDRNKIDVVDMKTYTVEKKWKLGKGVGPTGLAIDKKTKRLFAGCENMLVVLDAETGKVLKDLPIGEGCDGVAFDPQQNYIFSSNGSGTLTIIKENGLGDFTVLENVPTRRSARTLAVDEKTHKIYLPAAENGAFGILVVGK
jgi:YVTN family beta-propeller protein